MTRFQVGEVVVEFAVGDITEQEIDAIVNAANEGLRGGGGVDGAIHRAGGPEIMKECREIGHCDTGDAVATTAGNLRAKAVIHAVGPIYRRGGEGGAAELLSSAYRRSLEVAAARGLRSVAFPSISTGAYGYPIQEAARIAVQTVADYVRDHANISLVRFVLFTESDYEVYVDAATRILGKPQ
ncbi:MAG: O-acetyl-ADP-ribose deacetylase [Armatimonadota bacterium]